MHKPLTTVEFLDLLRSRKGLTSDYQVGKHLQWKQNTISSYRVGRTAFSAPHAIRMADELGLPRAYVLACIEAERENNDQVRGVWREIAERFREAAASVLLALLLGVGFFAHTEKAAAAEVSAPSSNTNTAAEGPYDVYYGKLRIR